MKIFGLTITRSKAAEQKMLEATEGTTEGRVVINMRDNNGDLNIYQDNPGMAEMVAEGFADVLRTLSIHTLKLNKLMSKQEQLDAAIASLQGSAGNIANDLTNLKGQIAAGTVSDESLANLQLLADTFRTIADSTPDAPAEGNGEQA